LWHVTLPAVRGPTIAGAFFALITSFDDPTVTAVGALMVLFAAVAVVAIESAVGAARLFKTESKR
jgi:putative spermidine/putrescine transport system permease protein